VTNVAQNAFDLSAEPWLVPASISATVLRLTILWELPFGHERRWLSARLRCAPSWEIELERDWTIASGFALHSAILGNTLNVKPGR